MPSLAALFLVATTACAESAAPTSLLERLKTELQVVLDEVSAATNGTVLQLGWKSDTIEFSLASGEFKRPGQTKRRVTVDDTFLFGSGTKPFTAAAVMSLVARGLLSLDDSLESHIDPVLDHFHPGASVQGLFGPEASNITVRHVLTMQSGIQDFDFPEFDNFLLRANETYRVHSPYEFVQYASTQKPLLLCTPGTCVNYSSNNFILVGFILLAHAHVKEWWQLDLASFFPPAARPSLRRLVFMQRESLLERLTVPGHTGGGWAQTPPTLIWNQSSTILGWTCGNVVGTALDVAGFLWDLLGPTPRVLPAAIVSEMKAFKPISLGWAAGAISYGVGLMIEAVNHTEHGLGRLSEWGSYMGHGGDTYGFLSEQGIVSGLSASLAIVANQDTDGFIITGKALCRTVQVSAKVLHGLELDLGCALGQLVI